MHQQGPSVYQDALAIHEAVDDEHERDRTDVCCGAGSADGSLEAERFGGEAYSEQEEASVDEARCREHFATERGEDALPCFDEMPYSSTVPGAD